MKHTLKAWLRKNQLTEDPNDYTATVLSAGKVNIDDIIDEIENDGTELKRETIRNIISLFNNKVTQMALSGYNVNTGLTYMRPVIKGAFYDKTWNPEANSVYVSMTQGAELREAIAETGVEILGEQSNPLEIYSITDQFTKATDGKLTRGRNVEIKGSYLKIIGDNAACGISFYHTQSKQTTKLAESDIVLNEPSRLLIFIPSTLEQGEYELSVTTQYTGGGTTLKEPRTVAFDTPVIVS